MIFELDDWVVPGSYLTMLSTEPSEEDRRMELEDAQCMVDEDLKNVVVSI